MPRTDAGAGAADRDGVVCGNWYKYTPCLVRDTGLEPVTPTMSM